MTASRSGISHATLLFSKLLELLVVEEIDLDLGEHGKRQGLLETRPVKFVGWVARLTVALDFHVAEVRLLVLVTWLTIGLGVGARLHQARAVRLLIRKNLDRIEKGVAGILVGLSVRVGFVGAGATRLLIRKNLDITEKAVAVLVAGFILGLDVGLLLGLLMRLFVRVELQGTGVVRLLVRENVDRSKKAVAVLVAGLVHGLNASLLLDLLGRLFVVVNVHRVAVVGIIIRENLDWIEEGILMFGSGGIGATATVLRVGHLVLLVTECLGKQHANGRNTGPVRYDVEM